MPHGDAAVKKSATRKPRRTPREKPHVFRFKGPDKQYQLNISIRKETVEPADLIRALEATLEELRALEAEGLERLLGGGKKTEGS